MLIPYVSSAPSFSRDVAMLKAADEESLAMSYGSNIKSR
jgi:hypothetical protein